jgi:RNA polymerase sigma-70 factor, ECF subfamily
VAGRLDPTLAARLHRQARADRWDVSMDAWAGALGASLERAPDAAKRDPPKYLASLHLEDLALAVACAGGHEQAWEHFVRELRPALSRAADALAPGGGARDIADALYGELFERALFRYFHGRSSLATWLRAVLAQRFVDRVRAERRVEPLPEDEAMPAAAVEPDPDRARHVALVQQALASAIAGLPPRDRLRLSSYYAEELTLAQTGRLLGEHEATVSRNLARTRLAIRDEVERQLEEQGMLPEEIDECFDAAVDEAGAFDLSRLDARKEEG